MTTIRKNIELGDPKYFCNKSWTVSYHVNAKAWISFHSYLPNFYIAENNFFYSGINGCCDDLDFIVGVIENPIDCSLEGTAKDVTICRSYGYGVNTYYCDTCLISGTGGIINSQPLTVGKWYYNARIGEKLHIDSDQGCQSNVPTDFISDADQQDNCIDITCPTTTTTTTTVFVPDCSLEGIVTIVVPECATLGRASNFDVLAHATITNTGSTVIDKDLGLYPGTSVTGFPPGIVNGVQHITDTTASNAKDDATAAFIYLGTLSPTGSVLADIGGTTITPGIYSVSSSLAITGTVILDGGGDSDAVFVFQIPSTFNPTSSAVVSLINNTQPCNVYWITGSSATLNTGAVVVGNIIANISVTFNTGASLTGKVFALTGAVTLDTNIITHCDCTINPYSISTTTTSSTTITTTTIFTPILRTANWSVDGTTYANFSIDVNNINIVQRNGIASSGLFTFYEGDDINVQMDNGATSGIGLTMPAGSVFTGGIASCSTSGCQITAEKLNTITDITIAGISSYTTTTTTTTTICAGNIIEYLNYGSTGIDDLCYACNWLTTPYPLYNTFTYTTDGSLAIGMTVYTILSDCVLYSPMSQSLSSTTVMEWNGDRYAVQFGNIDGTVSAFIKCDDCSSTTTTTSTTIIL